MEKINFENKPSTNTPINATNLNQLQTNVENAITENTNAITENTNAITENTNAINGVSTNLGGTILWTNSNPTSNFGNQTITLNSDDYDLYEIIYQQSTSNNRTLNSGKIKPLTGTILHYSTSLNYYRATSQTDKKSMSFDEGNSCYSYAQATANNQIIIPLYVIGYKTGLFN